jgi:uncharacterized RDD family membrane protein YckC
MQAKFITFEYISFFAIWHIAMLITETGPPYFTFMSEYTDKQRDEYLSMMTLLLCFLFLYQLISYWIFGGTLARRLAGLRLVNIDNSHLTFKDSLKRAVITLIIWLLILALGPAIGFIFGKGSEIFSLLALLIGSLVWFVSALKRKTIDGEFFQSQLDYYLGFKSIPVKLFRIKQS